MSSELLPSDPPAEKKPPTFGTASLVLAAVTVVVPTIILAGFVAWASEEPTEGWGWLAVLGLLAAGGLLAIVVGGFTSLLGSLAGGLALARGERGAWRSAIGLLINLPVLLIAAFLVVMALLNSNN